MFVFNAQSNIDNIYIHNYPFIFLYSGVYIWLLSEVSENNEFRKKKQKKNKRSSGPRLPICEWLFIRVLESITPYKDRLWILIDQQIHWDFTMERFN